MRQEDFDFERFVNLYSSLASEKRNWKPPKLDLSPATSRGARNIRLIVRIIRGCRERKIKISDYLNYMFSRRPPRGFKYPLLSHLASKNSFDIFIRSRQRNRRLVGKKGLKTYQKSLEIRNREQGFVNCWIFGYEIIKRALESFENWNRDSALTIFEVFMAFTDVFSPEFLVTHRLFSRFTRVAKGTPLGEVVFRYVKPAAERAHRDYRYREELFKARAAVRRRETKYLLKKFGNDRRWKRIMKILS